jgi:hypothetical protein
MEDKRFPNDGKKTQKVGVYLYIISDLLKEGPTKLLVTRI